MQKSDKIIYSYGGLQGLYWMSYGSISGFASVYLLDHGFSSGTIGFLIAFSCLTSILLQPVIASLADRSARYTSKKILSLIFLFQLIPSILLMFGTLPKVLIAVIYGISFLMLLSIQPLLSALGMQIVQHNIPLNFGAARAVGSFAYAVLTFCLGYITVQFSTRSLPVVTFLLYACMFLLLHTIPEMGKGTTSTHKQSGTIALLKKEPIFAFFVLGIGLIFISHRVCNNFMLQILNNLGKGSSEFGQIMAYIAMLELPAMLLCAKILCHLEIGKLLRLSAVFFLLKALAVALAGNLPFLYMGVSLQAVSFAPFTPAVVYFVAERLQKEDQVKGQALVTIGITAGNTVGSLSGGYMIEFLGVNTMLYAVTAFCALGVLMFFIGTKKPKHLHTPTLQQSNHT